MNKRYLWMTLCLVIVVLAAFQFKKSSDVKLEETFSDAIIRYGSTGKDVRELQGRMKFLGFFYGDVDGVFGTKTLNSVKYFQSDFGLKVDGIVGPVTKLKLWESTKKYKPSASELGQAGGKSSGGNRDTQLTSTDRLGLSENDLKIMANAVYGEARGEPYVGQVAVAAVILNRLKSPSFPNTINGVIFQPGAFTAVADGQIWLTPNETAKKAVMDALNGYDPAEGCLYYFNPVTATSKWIWTRPQVKKIGKHIFCD